MRNKHTDTTGVVQQVFLSHLKIIRIMKGKYFTQHIRQQLSFTLGLYALCFMSGTQSHRHER